MESIDLDTGSEMTVDLERRVIVAPDGREVPFEFSAKISDAWTGSRLIEAPSLGHKRILRDPGVIARAVDFGVSLQT